MALPEKSPEVDHPQNIGEVLSVDLKHHAQVIRLVDIRARGGVDLKRGVDAAAIEVDAVHDLLAVLGERIVNRTLEVKGETGVELNSAGDPETAYDLKAEAAAKCVALILRIGEMATGRYHGVVSQK